MSLHRLFICTQEVQDCKPIQATATPTVINAPVPGYLPKKNRVMAKPVTVPQIQKVLSEEANANSAGAIRWALELHRSGKSLTGKFEASDLRVDPCNTVKCDAKKKVLLKNATTKRRKKDFQRIRKIIKNDIIKVQSESDLPSDVQYLLDILKSYESGHEILIAHHPGVMNEDEKISLFNRLFSELEHIKVTDPVKYQQIINTLPYGNSYWRPYAFCNQHVYGVYSFRNHGATYLDSSEGAIYLYRNCFQHLITGHSTVIQGGVLVVLFVHKQMEHMLGTILPGVIHNLLVVLYNESALGGVF